jgi:ATP-dependent DNA ligase
MMGRFGRVQDIERMKKEIPLYFSDLLYLEGKPLLDEPYQKRFELLSERIPSAYRVPQIVTSGERKFDNSCKEA